jgi:hypothetical protein
MVRQQKETLAAIAVALLLAQTAERLIRLCMTFVLQQSSPLTLELLERQEKAERKKTLGYFLSELRKRAELDPSFDTLLERFLERRNALVHHFDHCLNTEIGLAGANAFLDEMITDTDKVLKVFLGLLQAWQDETGIGPSAPNHALFSEVEAVYKPLVNELFFRKTME